MASMINKFVKSIQRVQKYHHQSDNCVNVYWANVCKIFASRSKFFSDQPVLFENMSSIDCSSAYRQHIAGKCLLANMVTLEKINLVHNPLKLGPFNKPYLAGNNMGFNISHDGDVVALATTRQSSIGVDVMNWATSMDMNLVDVFSSSLESQMLIDTSELQRQHFAVKLFTAKEAVVKALGEGLQRDLSEVDVSNLFFTDSCSVLIDGFQLHVFANLPWPCASHCLSMAVSVRE